MSLNFAGISPHPPIIIPEIAKDNDQEKIGNTILAMRKLAAKFITAEIDTMIIISPHMNIYPDKFSICSMKKLFGTFASFDHPDIIVEAQNDLDFVAKLQQKLETNGLDFLLYDNDGEFFEMDHGIMVPLQYFTKNQEYAFKVVPIAYSGKDHLSHFAFGQVLGEVAKNYNGRIGILASGDLSHQLFQNPEAKVFDEQLVKDLKNNNIKDILYYEDEMLENIGECGYRSILILLGTLDGINAVPEIFSYEGPFGVGYGVVNYKLGQE